MIKIPELYCTAHCPSISLSLQLQKKYNHATTKIAVSAEIRGIACERGTTNSQQKHNSCSACILLENAQLQLLGYALRFLSRFYPAFLPSAQTPWVNGRSTSNPARNPLTHRTARGTRADRLSDPACIVLPPPPLCELLRRSPSTINASSQVQVKSHNPPQRMAILSTCTNRCSGFARIAVYRLGLISSPWREARS